MRFEIDDFAQHELTLIVSEDTRSLETLCRELCANSTHVILNIGDLLSKTLLHLPSRQRSAFAARWLEDQIHTVADTTLILCSIDLLFEPALYLDPLSLFTKCSRGRKLIVLWPGSYHKSILAYAVSEHRHYRIWKNPQVAIHTLKQSRYFQS